MKLNSIHIILLISFLAGFTACNKEVSDNFMLYSGNALNDTVWTRTLPYNAAIYSIFDSTAIKPVSDSFEISTGDTLHFSGKIDLVFPANCFTGSNGLAVTGKVKIELQSLLTKGDMIKAMQATTNYNALLESGGSFCIKASKNNQTLLLAPNAGYKIFYIDPYNDPSSNMLAFSGKEGVQPPQWGIDPDFTWIKNTDGSTAAVWNKPGSGYKGYEINAKSLRWISVAKFADAAGPVNNLNAILPPNFTNKNTIVFAVAENLKSVILLKSDYTTRTFSAINVPQQKKIKLISLSKIGKDFYLGERSVNDIGNYPIFKLTPERKSLKDILHMLESL